MVTAYRLNAVTVFLLLGLRIVRRGHFALPNLLAGEALVPEFFQNAVTGANLAKALQAQLADVEHRHLLEARFRAIHLSLRQDGAVRAANAVLELIGQPK